MDPTENAAPSRMPRSKLPSQIPPPGRGLSEMTASDNNARGTLSQPPERKHKVPGLPEPVPKRQTLADKAGQVSRSNLAAPASSRAINGSGRSAFNGGPRNAPLSSSVSSRPQSSFSRHTSTSSMSSSVSSSMRPPSMFRPHSAMAHPRTASQNSGAADRPATSTDGHSALVDQKGKRNGIVPISVSTDMSDHIAVRKTRGRYDANQNCTSRWSNSRAAQSFSSSRSSHSYTDPLPPPRETSLSKAFQGMSLEPRLEEVDESALGLVEEGSCPPTPSHIPRRKTQPVLATPAPQSLAVTPARSSRRTKSPLKEPFLNRFSNTKAPANWDTVGRLENMEMLYGQLQKQIEGSVLDRNSAQDTVELQNTRINQLEMQSTQLTAQNNRLQSEADEWRAKCSSTHSCLDEERRNHRNEVDDIRREHRNRIEDLRDVHRTELERAQRESRQEADGYKREAQGQMEQLTKAHREEILDLERRLGRELEEERSRHKKEVQEVTSQWAVHRQHTEEDNDKKEREAQSTRVELKQAVADLDRERTSSVSLRDKLTEATTNTMTLESSMRAMKAKIDFLESDNQAQSQAFADLNQRMQEAIEAAEVAKGKLQVEETLRRKLHNQVQELKGNIRVFCRVRPPLSSEEDPAAKIAFPDEGSDSKEVVVQGPEQKSALGNVTTANNAFSFDHVFGPGSHNSEVFGEISQLVQSALDGYNVCIFCYGQTGSGKTYTMSAADGMIPRTVQQIYATATALEEKGWTYMMEGSFVEVYNENLNDLLGKAEEFDKKKHEIRHDSTKGQTTITDVTTVALDGPGKVDEILKRASMNRSVAATKSNERSSRSHSVFILKLIGDNSATGEHSEGTLNLVDLAGSERIDKSGVQGARLKETQNINRSLSCLGDVIGALGQHKEGAHIPYRNSKLTYLLQFSLSGNSKTLMFVMISPLQAHLNETLTSLRFATKVHNTHIGTAKKLKM